MRLAPYGEGGKAETIYEKKYDKSGNLVTENPKPGATGH